MTLWIRSQNKSNLYEAKGIIEIRKGRFLTDNISSTITNYKEPLSVEEGLAIFVNGYIAGIYKTKERALEILDKIQKALNGTEVVARIGSKDYYETKTYSKDVAIFNMPEE